jgi:hypothetical protein
LCGDNDWDCFAICYEKEPKPTPKDAIKKQPAKKEEEGGFFDGWIWDVLLLGAKAAI